MTKLRRVLALSCLMLAAVACGQEEDADPAVSQNLTVETFDYYFEPTALSVDVGAEVTIELTNTGSVAHSWTATDLDVETEADSGQESSVTFVAPNEPGSYDFFCKFHPDDMQGTISIGGSDEPVEEAPATDDDDEDVDVDVETEEDTSGADDNY